MAEEALKPDMLARTQTTLALLMTLITMMLMLVGGYVVLMSRLTNIDNKIDNAANTAHAQEQRIQKLEDKYDLLVQRLNGRER